MGRGTRLKWAMAAFAIAYPVAANPQAPATTSTLRGALAQAYRSNPVLLAARADLRAADEEVPLQRADGLPSLTAAPSFSEDLYDSAGSLRPPRQAAAQVSLGVPLYAGGAVRNRVRSAETRVLAGRADLEGTESSVFSQVVAAYMDVIQNEAIVGFASANVDVLALNLEAAEDRFNAGELTQTDVAQSQSRLALARGDLRSAQANLVQAREGFVALVGSPPGQLSPPPPIVGLPTSVETAAATALQDNPDLMAAHHRAVAAGYDIKAAGASRLPRVELTGNANYSSFLGSVPISQVALFDDASSAVTLGVRTTVPFFQGGRPAALERQAQARASSALERVVATERDTLSQVRSAFATWQAANAIIDTTAAAVAAAALSLEGVRAENTVGSRTVLDILDAQQELLRAQVQLVTARRNAYVASFTLIAAMGQAEAEDLGLEEYGPLYDPSVNYRRVRNIVWDWARDPDPVVVSTRTVGVPAQDEKIQSGGVVLHPF